MLHFEKSLYFVIKVQQISYNVIAQNKIIKMDTDKNLHGEHRTA